ncbi:MAG: MFS transporter [Gemmatimonadaceae bacterium]|nr:MFS transporter [Gemmatimonadaceae bacterium]
MTGPRPDPYAALRLPAFRSYVVALFALTLGIQAEAVVVSWQLYSITRDALSLGLIGLAEALPFIAVALPAGHYADRHDRRTISVLATVALLGCAIALVVYSSGSRDPRVTWPLYAVIVVSGVARAFLQSARSALGAEIVPREHWTNAITWRSSTWQLASVVGPALAGGLYAWLGARNSYVVVTALYGVAIAGWLAIRERPGRHEPSEEVPMLTALREGVHFVFRQRILLGALTLDLFAVFFGGATALLPVFAATILHVGPEGLGILRAAPAAGAVLMSIALAHLPVERHVGRTLLIVVAGFGLTMIGFALSTSFWLSLALLFVSGLFDQVSVVVRSTLLTVLVPPGLMGRVTAVNSIFVRELERDRGVRERCRGAVAWHRDECRVRWGRDPRRGGGGGVAVTRVATARLDRWSRGSRIGARPAINPRDVSSGNSLLPPPIHATVGLFDHPLSCRGMPVRNRLRRWCVLCVFSVVAMMARSEQASAAAIEASSQASFCFMSMPFVDCADVSLIFWYCDRLCPGWTFGQCFEGNLVCSNLDM